MKLLSLVSAMGNMLSRTWFLCTPLSLTSPASFASSPSYYSLSLNPPFVLTITLYLLSSSPTHLALLSFPCLSGLYSTLWSCFSNLPRLVSPLSLHLPSCPPRSLSAVSPICHRISMALRYSGDSFSWILSVLLFSFWDTVVKSRHGLYPCEAESLMGAHAALVELVFLIIHSLSF